MAGSLLTTMNLPTMKEVPAIGMAGRHGTALGVMLFRSINPLDVSKEDRWTSCSQEKLPW
jgi:hypothetical protein